MPIITHLRPARRRPGYVEIEVDGTPLGLLAEREVAHRDLAVGASIDEETLAALESTSLITEALNLANGYLSYRPRTAAEVRQRLQKASYEEETIAAVLAALEGQGLLNDRRFAAMWVENRTAFSPRSARVLGMELRRKGIDRETIDATLASAETGDETALAMEAGRKRLRAFAALDEETFRRRMGGYLARRGFSFEAAGPAIAALWAEAHGSE